MYNETEKAIKILLLDKTGKMLPKALQLALDYTKTVPDKSLGVGCSVNEIAQRTAHYYLEKDETRKAIDCVKYFSKVKDKVNFFKNAESKAKAPELFNKAINVLLEAGYYDDLYHLLKGKEKFERGAEIAEQLQNSHVCCEFLLLLAKKKLLKDEYTKDEKEEEATMLEKACNKLDCTDKSFMLQVELICGILREKPLVCFNVCKKFITNINHFGAIEALNAAICLKTPIDLDIHNITVIVNCLQIAFKIVNEIKSSTKLSSQHLQHCRKFYLFEQSEDTFFLPPQQYYWVPALKNEHLPQPDSDGMVQFNEHKTYKILEQHITGITHKWLQLDLENALFNIMTTEEYRSLNSVLDKRLDISEFVKKCYKMSDYLLCCIKLIEISHCHCENETKIQCNVADKKLDKWEKLRKYASHRILDIFSPQWRYFFKFTKADTHQIKKSKVTCDCLLRMLRLGDEFTSDINIFLHNWHILKITGSDISTLIKCLLNEEAKLATKLESKKVENDQTTKISKSEREEKPCEINKLQTVLTRMLKSEESLVATEKPKELLQKHELSSNLNEKSEDLKDKETFKDSKENINKQYVHEIPAVFIKTGIGYSHCFFVWLLSCELLENGNFMGFAEGIIKRLFILIAKRKSFKPKITVMNITSILEILSIGLFASLKAAAAHAYKTNPLILFPKFYEHCITSYDPINFTSDSFLDLVTTFIVKSKNLEQLYDSCLHLLQRILQLLLGKIEPSFNVLRHASRTSFNNHGFERCLVLCLSIFGNLYPLLNKPQQANVYYLYMAINEVVYLHSQIIEENLPQLFTIIQDMSTIKSTEMIFTILLHIQESNQSHMISLQYQIQKKLFSFDEIKLPQFPTYEFKSSKHASDPQKSRQEPQYKLQPHKKPNVSIPKVQQRIVPHSAEKATSYTAAVTKLVPDKSTQPKSALEMSHISENVINESDQDQGETSIAERNLSVTYSESSTDKSLCTILPSNEAIPTTIHPPQQIEYTVPLHSSSSGVMQSVLGDSELLDTFNQSTFKKGLVDIQQINPDGSVKLDQQKNEKENLSLPLFQPQSNMEIFETTVDQTQEQFHLPQAYDDKRKNADAKSQSLSTPTAHSESVFSHSSTDAVESFTSTSDQHVQHAPSQRVITEDINVLFKSRLKPDAKSFEPAGTFRPSSSPSTTSGNMRQVQEPTLQAMHASSSYQLAGSLVQEPSFPVAVNTIPQPLVVPPYHVMGPYMSTPGMYFYNQPMLFPYQPLHPNMPWPNVPISPQADFLEFEDLKYYSFAGTTNVEASGNKNATNFPNDCIACGHMHAFEDEKSKANHYASTEHLNNTELYSAYQETVKKYAKDIDDARKIVKCATVHTGTSHEDRLIQAQVKKIIEWKNKFDRERSHIEDKFDWTTGQQFIENSANEIKALRKHYEELKKYKSL